MSKRKKILTIFLLLIIILLLFLPTIIKNYVINNSKELVGRQIQIEKLKINYFNGTAKVMGFKMLEANNQDLFVSFDTLVVNTEPYKYFSGKVVIENLYLKGLDVKVIKTDSVFNFDDIIAFFEAQDTIPEETTDSKPFKYDLSNLELSEADFHFDNRDVGKVTDIDNLSLFLPNISWDQEEKSNADIHFDFPNGGFVESKFNANPVTGEFNASLKIEKLFLNNFYEYVAQYADINSFEGSVYADVEIHGNTNNPVKSIVSGDATVNDFETTDTKNKSFLKSKSIYTKLDKIDYYNNSFLIDKLVLEEPYTFFQLDSMSNNFFKIFRIDPTEETTIPANTESTSSNTRQESELFYAINNLEVNKGVLDYTDNLTGQPFNYHLSNIKVDTKNIESTTKWIDINSTMVLNNRGNLVATVGLNPDDYYNNMKFDIAVEKFLLPDLNIYTNYYMGHSVLEGDMYYYSKSTVTNGIINSENRLLVKEAKLETMDAGLYSLPLKFAFFLLTDKNGDVNLEIPVEGDVNDPSVDVSTIVWNTVKNVIGKTVAQPINFLVGLVGGDPKDLEEIVFEYNDSLPSENQYKQLDKLLKLEQKKEGIAIEMEYFIDNDLQKENIAKKQLGQLFLKEENKDYKKNSDDFKAFLHKKLGSDSLDVTRSAIKLSDPVMLDSLSTSYNKLRFNSISNYLKTTNDSTNIQVKYADPSLPLQVGSKPVFKIKYGVEGEIYEFENDTIQ